MKWNEILKSLNDKTIFLDMIEKKIDLKKEDSVFTIGSSFVREIEDGLSDILDFPVTKYIGIKEETFAGRSRGILNKFTPYSISRELNWVKNVENVSEKLFENSLDIFKYQIDEKKIIDIGLHMPLPVTIERFINRRLNILEIYKQINKSKLIIITLGNIETHNLKDGRVLESITTNSNFLKNELKDIYVSKLDNEEVLEELKKIVKLIKHFNKEAKIIFSVSPIPMARNDFGNHIVLENFYNKTILVNNVKHVCLELNDVYYFPSFEFVNFLGIVAFEDDLRHVKKSVIELIIEGFRKMSGLTNNN